MKYICCFLILMSLAYALPAGAVDYCNACKTSSKMIFDRFSQMPCNTGCVLVPDNAYDKCIKRCNEYLGTCSASDCCTQGSTDDCALKYCQDIGRCKK